MYHVTIYYVAIQRYLLKLHKYVTVEFDVIFVNNISFLITMSIGIKFINVEHIPKINAKQISKSPKISTQIYSRGNMILQTDVEF